MEFQQNLLNGGNTLNVDRLRKLYAMMSGIPAKKVEMDMWRQSDDFEGKSITDQALIGRCDTHACLLGWASAYPEFKEAGLSADKFGWPLFQSHEGGQDSGAAFFGLTYDQADFLFSASGDFDNGKSQKQIALDRLAALLWKTDVISKKRFKELLSESKAEAQAEAQACYAK